MALEHEFLIQSHRQTLVVRIIGVDLVQDLRFDRRRMGVFLNRPHDFDRDSDLPLRIETLENTAKCPEASLSDDSVPIVN